MAQKYITYREEDGEGNLQYHILQKEHPHFVGVIYTYPKKVVVEASPIAGYNLWIAFHFCLRGSVIPSYNNVGDMISQTLEEMALWYLSNRIIKDEKKYKKFKINVTSTN